MLTIWVCHRQDVVIHDQQMLEQIVMEFILWTD